LTHATPGTGTSGMEFCVANLLEPGDRVLVCVQGYFGDRIRLRSSKANGEGPPNPSGWRRPCSPAPSKSLHSCMPRPPPACCSR
jgi:alanine-glyoxylate transaminase/serine-glyoxylate transaminase/serine-pyruvate transaminase